MNSQIASYVAQAGYAQQVTPSTPLPVAERNSGANGGKLVSSATASGGGNWYALQFVTSGTLSAYAGNISGTVTGVTFPAGFVLNGVTTSFTTGTGTVVVAYNA